MERYFEKISFEQFKKDIMDDKNLYSNYELPVRKTKSSAGYDFIAMQDINLKPNETIKIPTGYKANFLEDEALFIIIRSSLGFKYNIRMMNQVGVIESDYYNNIDNEGHMFVKLQNEGDKDFIVKKGDRICQCIFVKFLTVDDENEIENIRKGGFGSTNNGDENNG